MVLDVVQRNISTLAIVDEDPDAPKHPIYRELRHIYGSRHLNIYQYVETNSIIIEIRPRLEGWLLAMINETKQTMHIRDEGFLHARLSAKTKICSSHS